MRRALAVALAVLLVASCDPMVLARRLLIAGGGSSFVAAPLFPPLDASWTRYGSNPIMEATEAWEETGNGEPRVHAWTIGTSWRMWYNGGWDNEGQGYATSLDGISWTKEASNPVYGQGGSGVSGWAVRAFVYPVGATLYLFTSRDTGGPDFDVATSTDGIAWTTQSSSATLPAGCTLWGNRAVWKEGADWKMLQECGPSPWQIYLFESSDGLSWTIQNSGNPLSDLDVATGNYGGPTIAMVNGVYQPKHDGLYQIWFHAGDGNLTDIYHATSADLLTWTVNGPVLTHSGSGFEIDQVADPSVLVVGTDAYLYFTGVDNTAEVSKIGVALGTALP